jgi:hypothetical protein
MTPLPNIQEAIEGLGDKVLFSKYNIREGYNNIQIIPEDWWKAAFKTLDGLFEPNVMLFSLQGAPGTFSRMITINIAPMYHEFPQNRFKHYMNDCLIATGEGELQLHRKMNHRLLDLFKQHSYFLKPSKCVFEQLEVDFLGVWLGHGEITIDPSKIAGIGEWPSILKNIKEVQSTLGILGFQRPFIPGFATIARPLTSLLNLSMDRRMHISFRTSQENCNFRTSAHTSRPRSAIHSRSRHIPIRDRCNTLSGGQENDRP